MKALFSKLLAFRLNWDFMTSHSKTVAIVSTLISVLFYAIVQQNAMLPTAQAVHDGINFWQGKGLLLFIYDALRDPTLYAIGTFVLSFVASLIAGYINFQQAVQRINAIFTDVSFISAEEIGSILSKTENLFFIRLSKSITEDLQKSVNEFAFSDKSWSYHLCFIGKATHQRRERKSFLEVFSKITNEDNTALAHGISTLQFGLRHRNDFEKIVQIIHNRLLFLFLVSGNKEGISEAINLDATSSIILIGSIESMTDEFIPFSELVKKQHKHNAINIKRIIINTGSEESNPVFERTVAQDIGMLILKNAVNKKAIATDIIVSVKGTNNNIEGGDTQNLKDIVEALEQ